MFRQQIEWVNFRWDHAPDTSRPRVLLIGDSIANGYHGPVSASLKDRFNVDLLATSKCVADPAFVRETRFAMEEYSHALIHFNNGLHGGHLTDAEYEAGLRGRRPLRRSGNSFRHTGKTKRSPNWLCAP